MKSNRGSYEIKNIDHLQAEIETKLKNMRDAKLPEPDSLTEPTESFRTKSFKSSNKCKSVIQSIKDNLKEFGFRNDYIWSHYYFRKSRPI